MEKREQYTPEEREKRITDVTLTGSATNLFLTAFKIFAGIVGRSSAMIADGIHSASDLLSDIVVIVFVRISSRKEDKGHDFGHGKFETLATLIVSLMLFTAGFGIMTGGIKSIISIFKGNSVASPSYLALAAAIISIVSKEVLYRYTKKAGDEMNSPVVVANAWHHRSDALSSIGSLAGIGTAMLFGNKWSVADPIASCLISIMIFWVAIKMSIPAINDLLECSLPDETENDIVRIASEVPGVRNIHSLKTRRNGPAIIMEAHIVVDPGMTVMKAHDIATDVENAIMEKYGRDTHISIHIEPDENSE
ncbi:MAG: cation diffusion facilitator family transporter [Bacteroidales bacterium]|jgi:cation diffusion facilitator family transporter|nr:cation diffusion facilitator family transporter [Bacteroidales bacterium]